MNESNDVYTVDSFRTDRGRKWSVRELGHAIADHNNKREAVKECNELRRIRAMRVGE